MTLIVAIGCKDSIIVASETQVTINTSGSPVRETVTKIRKLNDSTLWAASGDVSVIQQVERGLESLPVETKRLDMDDIIPHVKRLVVESRSEILGRYRTLYGEDRGERLAPSSSLILAGYAEGRQSIIEVYQDGDYEECEPEVGFVALGIGDIFAHSVLHGRRLNGLSSEEAALLAYKVVKDAIEVGAYGLGEPIDIWTVKPGSSGCLIEQLSKGKIDALADAYIALKEAESELLKPPGPPNLGPKTDEERPEQPKRNRKVRKKSTS